MTNYIIRRLFEAVPVMLGVSILVFMLVHLIPGDPAITLLGERATEENVERLRENLGLNKPLFLNFQGSDATPVAGTETIALYAEPDDEEPAAEIDASYVMEVTDREEGWIKISAAQEETLTGWVQDENASTNFGQVQFREDRLRAFAEPVERGARRMGSIETSDLTVLSEGEEGWYEVTWIKTQGRESGWVPEDQLDVTVRPFDSQYFTYMGNILQGDLGSTVQGNVPIAGELRRRLPATFELSIYALFLSVIIGIPIGVVSAVHRNSLIDTFSMIGALIGVSIPIFWLGLVLIYIFSIEVGVLPMVGRVSVGSTLDRITGIYTLDALLQGNWPAFVDVVKHLLMPAIVLSTIPVSIIARITRSSMLEVLGQDYVRAARAKGVARRIVINKHALRNALLPIVTIVGLQLGTLLSGAVLTETIFSWPGIGRWMFDAILRREYTIIQNVTLIIALIFVVVNLLVDISYAVLDPRIRLS